ncbi:MAG: DUF362 domain-containing protein [Thermanaeromonas sp.]|uniref:DUF362 domain-containing protein n=1 Tax=Thermanaeromonas sp. TaxID=2003697 RepID=UPI00243DB1C7|nr:DUF362 domain-containing protein [Thermanaeromonas sp.]MCG0278459.1 DUF362 domain-containing protein [Thermanaeromonas sp.]
MRKPESSYDATTKSGLVGKKPTATAKVYLVKTRDRKEGVKRLLALLGPLAYAGKSILVKPNFNTADPAPGSTHNDTLEQLLIELKAAGPSSIAVGERSGPPLTEIVLKQKGVIELCDRLGVKLINYDKLPPEGWVKFWREGLHWRNGFYVAKPVLDADVNIGTCTLKTHAYGGVFSMSLKLAVGITPRRGYSLMSELHSSPHMGKMIAEINLAYTPDFVLMDGVDVFVDGGPDRGTRREGNVMLLSRDRVALDAVGLAVLKDLGSNRKIMEVPIFKQEQISRAVELGLGVRSAEQIEIIADDREGKKYASRLEKILRE